MRNEPSHETKSKLKTRRERGAGLVEYTLLVALISIVSIASVKVIGKTVKDTMTKASAGAGYIENP